MTRDVTPLSSLSAARWLFRGKRGGLRHCMAGPADASTRSSCIRLFLLAWLFDHVLALQLLRCIFNFTWRRVSLFERTSILDWSVSNSAEICVSTFEMTRWFLTSLGILIIPTCRSLNYRSLTHNTLEQSNKRSSIIPPALSLERHTLHHSSG